MKTYLGFKRTLVNQETGEKATEMKFIPVDVPGIDPEDGWKLVGTADSVSIESKPVEDVGEQLTIPGCDMGPKLLKVGASFESPVTGTARLVRRHDEIKITYRKGKKTLNQTSPNSVCISEQTKNAFFADCRGAFGKNCDIFAFRTTDPEYEYWSNLIDKEYTTQLQSVNARLSKEAKSSSI